MEGCNSLRRSFMTSALPMPGLDGNLGNPGNGSSSSGNGSLAGTTGTSRGSGGLRRFVKPTAPPPGASPDLLARFEASQRPKPQPGESCEMCGTMVGPEHGHVVNIESRELMCACRPCYLLFTKEGAGQGKYRVVPDRYLVDPYFRMDEGQWEQIQIPVSMAFFFYNSTEERFVAFYPSPAGATESLLDLASWQEVLSENTAFEGILPDVEALVVKKENERFECYLVPIDSAYELTAIVRMNWKGFSGGEQVWEKIESYFSALRDRSAVVGFGPRT
jgi:hypothetical protein